MDKFIGYFIPSYMARRREEVKKGIEGDGGARKLMLSEMEKRLGITGWFDDPDWGLRGH